MKKLSIWLIGVLFFIFLLAAVGCDGTDGGGCGATQDDGPSMAPTCGKAVIDEDGEYNTDTELFVNWTGDGAPTGPSNNPGFSLDGEPRPMNAYTWALAPFDGCVYAGVYNRINDRQGELGDVSEGGEVWRYKPGPTVNSGKWEREAEGGFDNPTNLGIRTLKEYNGKLYAGTHNLDEGTELWRRSPDTANGKGGWERLAKGGFDTKANNAVRAMAVYNNILWLGTAANQIAGAKLFSYDGSNLSKGIRVGGTTKANVISELVPFEGKMWIFTWGGDAGLSAYRMDAQGKIEHASGVVVTNKNNAGIMSSAVYNGKIYVGTVNVTNGAEFYVLENPSAADITTVTIKRLGAKVFQTTESYLWRMQVFNGQLYIGTWNQYYFLNPLLSTNNIGGTLYRMNNNEQFCRVMGHGDLIEPGFGKSENYGIRSMTEYKDRLYIGTAQPFKIEPGSDDSNAANRKGTEVWEFDAIK